MDKIKFNCPYCDKRINAPAKAAGRKAQCPGCQKAIRVPSLEALGAPAPEAVESPPNADVPPAPAVDNPPPVPESTEAVSQPPPTPRAPGLGPPRVPSPPPATEAPTAPDPRAAALGPPSPATPSLAASDPAFRQWVIDHVPKRLAGRTAAEFHIYPDIPAKMVSGATSAYAKIGPDEQILMLFDNSLMGSAKSGIVLTDRGVYWKGESDAHKAYYEELEDVRFEKKKLLVRLRGRDYLLTWPDMGKMMAAKARPFGEVLREVFDKVRNECAPPPATEDPDESFGAFGSVLVSTLRTVPSGNLFVAPDIPDKKLANASATYAHPKDGEKILALFDDTVFGSAKTGFCLTQRRMVWTNSQDVSEISWSEVTSLELAAWEDRKLKFHLGGNQHALEMTVWNKKNIGALALALSRAARRSCEDQGLPAPAGVAQLEQIARDRGVGAEEPTSATQEPKVEETSQPAAKPIESLEDAIREACSDDLYAVHVHPGIPEKKLANALAGYATLEPGEKILALFDDTVFRSAKTGFCLTDRRLVWQGASTGGTLSYNQLPGITEARRTGEKVRIRLADGMRTISLITWTDEQISFLLRVLCAAAELEARKTNDAETASSGLFALQQCRKLVAGEGRGAGPVRPATASPSSVAPVELPAEMRSQIERDLPQVLSEYTSEKLFVAPNIPADRLEGARAGYAELQSEEQVLSLFDSSVTQSGATGLCLTNLRVVWHEPAQGRSVAYSDVLDIRHGGDKLCLVTDQEDHVLALGEFDPAQVDGLMTALLRIHRIVFSEGEMVLRITHAVLLDVGGDPRSQPGALAITTRLIVWLPEDGTAVMNSSLQNITGLQISPDQRRLSFRDQGTRVEFELAEAASLWVQYLDEAIDAHGSPPAEETSAEPPAAPVSLSRLILSAMKPLEASDFCVAPQFNEKKLNNAKKTYLHLGENEELLVLFDDTFWGSAKRGFAMTDRRLLWKDDGAETMQVVYSDVRDVCHEGSIVLFILADYEFAAFSMTSLSKQLAETMGILFSRLADACRKQYRGSAEQDFRFLRTSLLPLTEVNGKEVEPTSGLLCLTNHVLIWMDEESNRFGIPLDDVKSCWKALVSQTFWVQRHTLKSGLMGDLGLAGRASFGWKARGDAKQWVAAINQAVADIPPTENQPE